MKSLFIDRKTKINMLWKCLKGIRMGSTCYWSNTVRVSVCSQQSNIKTSASKTIFFLLIRLTYQIDFQLITHCDYKWHCIDHLQYEGYLENLFPDVPLERKWMGNN